jgi:hypothetical protein
MNTPNENPLESVPAQNVAHSDGTITQNEGRPAPGITAETELPQPNAEEDKSTKLRRKLANLRKAGVFWLEIGTFIALIAYATITKNQWQQSILATTAATSAAKTAKDTLDEIRNSKADTQKLIDFSKKQADAATAFAASAEGIKQDTEAAIGQFRRLADATQGSVDITRNDQRAWVGVVNVPVTPELPIKPGSTYVAQPFIQNTGRTPAVGVTFRFAQESRLGNLQPTFEYFDRPEGHAAVIMPGQVVSLGTLPLYGGGPFTDAQVNSIILGEGHLYLFGLIHYSDIFKVKHTTQFCYQYSPAGALMTCESHNDAD